MGDRMRRGSSARAAQSAADGFDQGTMNLDTTDLRILRELQADASLSNVELARRVGLSASPCLARVKALESGGLIRQYVALLDAQRLGLHLNVFISISLKQQTRAALESFEAKIAARDEVMECYLMTGDRKSTR